MMPHLRDHHAIIYLALLSLHLIPHLPDDGASMLPNILLLKWYCTKELSMLTGFSMVLLSLVEEASFQRTMGKPSHIGMVATPKCEVDAQGKE